MKPETKPTMPTAREAICRPWMDGNGIAQSTYVLHAKHCLSVKQVMNVPTYSDARNNEKND